MRKELFHILSQLKDPHLTLQMFISSLSSLSFVVNNTERFCLINYCLLSAFVLMCLKSRVHSQLKETLPCTHLESGDGTEVKIPTCFTLAHQKGDQHSLAIL